MQGILFVGLGGFMGACLRWGITKWSQGLTVPIPMGTLLSNVIAGFVIGFAIGMERNFSAMPEKAKLFLNTGLLGGLSTFSTFSLETVQLFEAGKYLPGVCNVLLNLGLSMAGVVLGMLLARVFLKKA